MDGVGVYLTAVLGLLVVYLLFRKPAKPVPAIPGLAPSDPVKGNFPDIGAAGTMNNFQLKHHAKFGGIFSFWYGKTQVVSIAHPDYVRDINQLECRPRVLFEFAEDWIGKDSIQFTNFEAYHKRRRGYVEPSFGFRAVQQYEHEFLSIYTDEVFPIWRANAGKPLDLKSTALSVAVKTITQVNFGVKQTDQKLISEFLECYNITFKHLYSSVKGEQSPVPEAQYRASLDSMHRLCKNMAENRKATGVSEPFRFIDLLMKEVNPDQVAAEMVTFFIAGFHTTGYTLLWMLFFLAKYPQEQEKVRAEVERQIPKSQAVVATGDLDAERFKAVFNFVEETLRLGQPGPYAARVNETADIRLHDGKVIPRGTPVIQALIIMATSSGLWENAMEFFPDRFNGPTDSAAFMPFGGLGKRVCPGKNLLYAEAHVFLANLVRHFTVSFPPGFDSRVELESILITTMKNDPLIVITPRT